MTIREHVANYIKELTNERITDHGANLFGDGLLTSLDVLDLISFIETAFDFQIAPEDADMENFGTIDGIVNLIEREKQG
jgi:acyl carrier protein